MLVGKILRLIALVNLCLLPASRSSALPTASSEHSKQMRFSCRDRILEILSLPAEGRFDSERLVSFDQVLRDQLKNIVEKRSFALEPLSKELGFHLFPSRLAKVKEHPNSEEIIGFDSKGVYVQLLNSSETVEDSSFRRRYIVKEGYNQDRQVDLIQIPNLFESANLPPARIETYLNQFGSRRSGEEVMGYLLLHEWIHAQQSRNTSWGFYLSQYHSILNESVHFKKISKKRLLHWGWTALVTLSGHRRLSSGAELLSEFQAQSIAPLPGLNPKEIQSLWKRILKQVTSNNSDWEDVRRALSRFQALISQMSRFDQSRRAAFAANFAVDSAIDWLHKTKSYHASSR